MQERQLRTLSPVDITTLLELAKKINENDWRLFSYFIATGKRLSEVENDLAMTHRQIIYRFRKYSKLLGFKLIPHMLRRFYYTHWKDLGIHTDVIEHLIGHKISSYKPSFFS